MGKVRRLYHKKWRGQRVTELLCRDGDRCSLCPEKLDRKISNPLDPLYVTFDHVRPRSHGGLDGLNNLRLAHRVCNCLRGNDPLLPEEEDLPAVLV